MHWLLLYSTGLDMNVWNSANLNLVCQKLWMQKMLHVKVGSLMYLWRVTSVSIKNDTFKPLLKLGQYSDQYSFCKLQLQLSICYLLNGSNKSFLYSMHSFHLCFFGLIIISKEMCYIHFKKMSQIIIIALLARIFFQYI